MHDFSVTPLALCTIFLSRFTDFFHISKFYDLLLGTVEVLRLSGMSSDNFYEEKMVHSSWLTLLPSRRTELATSYLLTLVVDIFSSTTKSAIDREPNHGTSSLSRDHQMGIDGV